MFLFEVVVIHYLLKDSLREIDFTLCRLFTNITKMFCEICIIKSNMDHNML